MAKEKPPKGYGAKPNSTLADCAQKPRRAPRKCGRCGSIQGFLPHICQRGKT